MDMLEDKLKGEMMDLQHGLALASNVRIKASTGKNKKEVSSRLTINSLKIHLHGDNFYSVHNTFLL